eukprot:764534-Hanusia_phi.AAC.1
MIPRYHIEAASQGVIQEAFDEYRHVVEVIHQHMNLMTETQMRIFCDDSEKHFMRGKTSESISVPASCMRRRTLTSSRGLPYGREACICGWSARVTQ